MTPTSKQSHSSQYRLFLLGSFRLEFLGTDAQSRGKSQIITLPIRKIGDKSLLARGLRSLSNALMQTDTAKARQALQESVALCRQIGDKSRLAYTLDALGKIAEAEQATASAVAYSTEGIDLLREVPNRVNLAGPIHSLGQALLAPGEHQ